MTKKDEIMVSTQALEKEYEVGDGKLVVLKDITLQIPKAKFVVLCGPSGSSKTTLLNIIGGIDRPTKGKIVVADQDLTVQNEDFLSDFRCNNVGFVFQALQFSINFNGGWKRCFPDGVEAKTRERNRETGGRIAINCGFGASGKPFPT